MSVAQRFFEAFRLGDYHTMAQLYAPEATFSDPAFPLLSADEAGLMWRMLVTRAGGELSVSATVEEGPNHARVIWIARYPFGPRRRRVVNRIYTEMDIVAGKIVRHVDRFNFWRWSRQALGWKGWLLGWTPWLRKRVQMQAAESLRRFAQKEYRTLK
jgi:hypothetical protein